MTDPASKPRVLLSILKCNYFEHLEGELLFTAISAGFGRFECERLLKPSGVELMNLPRSANIEVSVLRWCPADQDGERQKQLLYHGLVSLSAVHPTFSKSDGRGGERDPQVWENWLGLFSSDVNLKAKTPEQIFQRCLEMGTSSARFPRLLLRLQYMPPGVSAAPRSPVERQPSELPAAAVGPDRPPAAGGHEGLGEGGAVAGVESAASLRGVGHQTASAGGFQAGYPGDASPVRVRAGIQAEEDWRSKYEELCRVSETNKLTWAKQRAHLEHQLEAERQAVARTAGHQMESDVARHRREAEELQTRCQELEHENLRLRERGGGRGDEAPLLALAEEALSHAVCAESGLPSFDAWLAALGDEERSWLAGSGQGRLLAICRQAAALRSGSAAAGPGQPLGDSLPDSEVSFYRPVKSDPVDCLLAASLLRLDREPPFALELSRVEPGLYRLGVSGPRFRCHIESGRLMIQTDAPTGGEGRPAMEFGDFIAAGPEVLTAAC